MTNENLLNEQSVDVADDNGQYIEAIEQLKANSVSKDKYAKLEAENKKLLDSLINGSQIDLPSQDKEVDIPALRKELFNPHGNLSNLEYIEKSLELREALLEKGEVDPFLPIGKNISPTADDYAQAEKVATIFKECVEYADGDSQIFTQELMRRTNDAMPKAASKNKPIRR